MLVRPSAFARRAAADPKTGRGVNTSSVTITLHVGL
jgi:hypothetical protein